MKFSFSKVTGNHVFQPGNALPPAAPPPPRQDIPSGSTPKSSSNRRELLLKDAVLPESSAVNRSKANATNQVPSAPSAAGNGSKPLSAELKNAIAQFLAQDASRKFFSHRPDGIKSAKALLLPLQEKEQLTRRDQLRLIDVSEHLQGALSAKPGKYPGAASLIDEIDRFIGSGNELHEAVNQLAGELERNAEVPSFSRYMQEHYPMMVTGGQDGGELQLTEEGRKNYQMLKQNYESAALDRHVVPTSTKRLNARDLAVIKIIENTYRDYQQALRGPGDTMQTRRRLLECADIVTQLAKAKPEKVKKDRIATVFPGGVSDPSQLEPGKIYKEPGFVFVGGERSSDLGHRMTIEVAKGYPVDARQYYGHSRNNDDKLQWITLPGGEFRFDGVAERGGKPTYLFSQVSR